MFSFFLKRLQLPCDFKIPNNANEIQANENIFQKIKESIKFTRKYLYFLVFGNSKLQMSHLPSNVKNILWIGNHSDSIGDSLMECAARSMMVNYNVDLLATTRNASVFQDDIFFQHVYINPQNISKKYEFIILDYFSTKSLKLRKKYFNDIPYFCMYEFFYGPDFNRLKFGYCRISKLLGLPYIESNSKYFITAQEVAFFSQYKINVGIAIGGIDDIRTYKYFKDLVVELNKHNDDIQFFLFGAENGVLAANEIEKLFVNVTNFVGKLNIQQTAYLISKMSIFIACDGGLLHVAQAYKLPIISIFAKFKPEFRLSNNELLNMTLYDREDVNNISIIQVANIFYNWRQEFEN